MPWKWDQGRLAYFRFDNLKAIAAALVPLDGTLLDGRADNLRTPLSASTGLPFSPQHYSVWRNYARVFECALLATKQGRRLRVTELCRALAVSGAVGVDQYAGMLMRRFAFPFSAFEGYSPTERATYPFCATVRFLISRMDAPGGATASLDDIFSYVAGNGCVGNEAISVYASLRPTNYAASVSEVRQAREMLIAFSQMSILNWESDQLSLDLVAGDRASALELERLATPEIGGRLPNRADEILRMGAVNQSIAAVPPVPTRETHADRQFTEGKRVRATHLRIERNPRLRKAFFDGLSAPYHCDVCGAIVNARYPWVDNLLHAHHVLPLGSAARIEATGTSTMDLVALCPTCHDAVHAYYRKWLDDRGADDFPDKATASATYADAKSGYTP